MQDPLEWLPELLKFSWDQAVDSLRSEGVDVVPGREEIWGAHDRRSGGPLQGLVRMKVYEAGDLVTSRKTHGDLDKDVSQTFNIDLQTKDGGDQARRRVHEAWQVVVRVLELYRRNPNADWNEANDVKVATVNSYSDYQHKVVSVTLRRYGQVMPSKLLQSSV